MVENSPGACCGNEWCHINKDVGVCRGSVIENRTEKQKIVSVNCDIFHIQGNASIFYFTLDVLETECLVISRKHWETCEFRPSFGISDFGRCNAVLYISQSLQRERLYGYNCTISPVPPKLYECKDCPARISVLENVQQYTAEAERILERYIQDSNQTIHFKVERVTKAFVAVASKTVYYIEFTIEETTCPNSSLVSGCKSLPEREAHIGFCRGKVLNGTKDAEGVEVESCEIYDIQLGRHPLHSRPRNDSEESHHPCKVSRHRCRDRWHGHHHPEFHPRCRPHHHHHHHHHHRPPPFHPHHHHPHHHHHHRHFRPHDHHRHRHCHSFRPCGSAEPVGPSNSSKESQETNYPDLPPPPGPQYPLPPPGGPHHFPPSQFPAPPNGPPPSRGPPFKPLPPDDDDDHHHHHHHHHHHPPPEEPNFHPPPRSPCGSWHRHHHSHQKNNTVDERREDTSSKDHDSFQSPYSFLDDDVTSVHLIPLASEQDLLQDPGTDFIFRSDDKDEKAVAQPFPLTPSESESCPGKPKFDLSIDLLSLYPPPPTH